MIINHGGTPSSNGPATMPPLSAPPELNAVLAVARQLPQRRRHPAPDSQQAVPVSPRLWKHLAEHAARGRQNIFAEDRDGCRATVTGSTARSRCHR